MGSFGGNSEAPGCNFSGNCLSKLLLSKRRMLISTAPFLIGMKCELMTPERRLEVWDWYGRQLPASYHCLCMSLSSLFLMLVGRSFTSFNKWKVSKWCESIRDDISSIGFSHDMTNSIWRLHMVVMHSWTSTTNLLTCPMGYCQSSVYWHH